MIIGARKIPVLRYFLIVLLFSALFVSSLYLYLHYKKAKSLRANIENLISEREKSSLIDSCIISLYSADNNSRLYTLTGDKKYLHKFAKDVADITTVVNKIKFAGTELDGADPQKFKAGVDETIQFELGFPGGAVASCLSTYSMSYLDRFFLNGEKGFARAARSIVHRYIADRKPIVDKPSVFGSVVDIEVVKPN